MSRWLNASASAGSSRNVGTNDVLSRTDPPAVPSAGFARAILPWGEPRGGPSRPPSTLFGVGGFIRALDAGVVDEALDGLAAEDVGLEDLLEVLLLDARVPHVVGIDHDHRTVAALREAAGLVDPHVGLEPGAQGFGPQELDVRFDVAPRRTILTARAHEDVAVVLAHQAPPPAAAWAALRSDMNRSTSSRIACTMSFSGTLRTTSPFLKMSPMPRPPATPMSAARASPGPLTSQPMTAMWISSLRPRNSSSTSLASLTRSTSARPQEGQDTKVSPPVRSPRALRMSIPTRTSSVGSALSETRIVSPIPSESSAPRPTADLIVPTPGVPASVTPRWNG